MARKGKYSQEVRERAVRMVFEHEGRYGSRWETVRSIAEKLGCSAEALRQWVKQAEIDAGTVKGLPTDERNRLKALEREVSELRPRERDTAQGVRLLRTGRARPPTQGMVTVPRRAS